MRDEYALSPGTRSGRVRVRPTPLREIFNWPIRGRNIGEFPAWPGPVSNTNGHPRPSTRAWILVVSPPRERPIS